MNQEIPISYCIEPYNFITLSSKATLKDIIIILKNKVDTPQTLIIKENNTILGHLPINKIPGMVAKAYEQKKDFCDIFIEKYFLTLPPAIDSYCSMKKIIEYMKLYKTTLLGIKNNQDIFISVITWNKLLERF